jgi:hypothetical protein
VRDVGLRRRVAGPEELVHPPHRHAAEGLCVPLRIAAPELCQRINDQFADGAVGVDGTYEEGAANFSQPNPATKAMLATLTKYDKSYSGGIPDLGLYGSWLSADLMIKGL